MSDEFEPRPFAIEAAKWILRECQASLDMHPIEALPLDKRERLEDRIARYLDNRDFT